MGTVLINYHRQYFGGVQQQFRRLTLAVLVLAIGLELRHVAMWEIARFGRVLIRLLLARVG